MNIQKIRLRAVAVLAMAFSVTVVAAQVSVTTIGATDAQACYQEAADDSSISVRECNEALKGKTNLTRRDVAKTHVNRGIIFNRAGLSPQAINDFDAAIEIIPGLAEAYLNRGNSYYLLQRYDIALENYNQALALDLRKAYAAWYNIGLTYDAMKKPEKAREAYEKSLAAFPDFALAKKKLERYED